MDSNKQLTIGDIEELKRLHLVVTQDIANFPDRAPHYYAYFCQLMFDILPRLISLLPTDAEVREEGARIQREVETLPLFAEVETADLRHLLCAVQAPRLTEQVAELLDAHVCVTDAIAATWCPSAAFPEAFEWEV